jgi:rhamnose utilization protein RhaD (predicted bifunctional aldolase and dehydrogenase)/NAD(P)-dependent dehydrogenase (short-subunit alcohol dehydrogenase family)
MKSRWDSDVAEQMVVRYQQQGVPAELALRVYTSRLLGSDPKLVLHGGGNTSVKLSWRDACGEELEVICVKGSGWDMAAIEPAGIPAVRLAPLRRLQALEQLSDEEMVNAQRCNLLDSRAPNPSVETLLHAFVPHKYIDHTHASAVLAVSDQAGGLQLCRDIFGPTMVVLDYVMPGFKLAKAVARAHAQQPDAEGVILHKHGIFTFGATAREAYERMIAMVTRAEEYIASRPRRVRGAPVKAAVSLAQVVPVIRGALGLPLGEGRYARLVAEVRAEGMPAEFCSRADLQSAAWRGVITPDHTIRIKNRPLVLPSPGEFVDVECAAAFQRTVRECIMSYVRDYAAYFRANDPLFPGRRQQLDAMPRVVLVQGLGLIAFGRSKQEAIIHADLACATIETVLDAEAVGGFEPLPESDLFEVEYWSLEQAKLGKSQEPALARQVALITGAAGAIGRATAQLFAQAGAELVLLDIDATAVQQAARAVGGHALGIGCDVTDAAAVRAAFDAACEAFGGVDLVVSNAGAAFEGAISTLDAAVLRRSFELNFFAQQYVAQNAVRVMLAQGTGGALLFNVSKQAVNPGRDFGAYGTAKAATLLLSRQYALEHGADGIRCNAVNADRIRSGLLTEAMIRTRAHARGVSELDYMSGNLLGQEVLAKDVAQAFLALAMANKTTGHVMTVDGGNIAAALR